MCDGYEGVQLPLFEHLPNVGVYVSETEIAGVGFGSPAIEVARCDEFHVRTFTGALPQGRPMLASGVITATEDSDSHS